ncbi:MAG: hypothetical protein ACOC32_04255 [Nanoarchaeota archaeon]
MKQHIMIIGIIFFVALLLGGCTQTIDDMKDEDMIGKEVSIEGTVDRGFKLGDLSGFILSDDNESIHVSSDAVPASGDEVTVTARVRRSDILDVYYLDDAEFE